MSKVEISRRGNLLIEGKEKVCPNTLPKGLFSPAARACGDWCSLFIIGDDTISLCGNINHKIYKNNIIKDKSNYRPFTVEEIYDYLDIDVYPISDKCQDTPSKLNHVKNWTSSYCKKAFDEVLFEDGSPFGKLKTE